MTVRIEKDGAVWTIVHDRPEARNAMDPASADALTDRVAFENPQAVPAKKRQSTIVGRAQPEGCPL